MYSGVSTEDRSFTPGKEFAVLTLMVGGDEDDVARFMPVLEAMAKNIIHQGNIGTGQVCKLVNNLAVYANGIVARECVNLGPKAGLNLEKMKRAMSLSTSNSRVLMGTYGYRSAFTVSPASETFCQRISHQKSPSRRPRTKDKRLALEMAEDVGAGTSVVRLMEKLNLESTYYA